MGNRQGRGREGRGMVVVRPPVHAPEVASSFCCRKSPNPRVSFTPQAHSPHHPHYASLFTIPPHPLLFLLPSSLSFFPSRPLLLFQYLLPLSLPIYTSCLSCTLPLPLSFSHPSYSAFSSLSFPRSLPHALTHHAPPLPNRPPHPYPSHLTPSPPPSPFTPRNTLKGSRWVGKHL